MYITRRHCSKFSVEPMLIWTSQNSTTVWQHSGYFWFTLQARWQVAGQLQFHCLSRLNPFIPCVCAITYVSSSTKVQQSETRVAPASRPCCSLSQSHILDHLLHNSKSIPIISYFKTRVPKNTYPVHTEYALSEYCMCSTWHMQLRVSWLAVTFCTAHASPPDPEPSHGGCNQSETLAEAHNVT